MYKSFEDIKRHSRYRFCPHHDRAGGATGARFTTYIDLLYAERTSPLLCTTYLCPPVPVTVVKCKIPILMGVFTRTIEAKTGVTHLTLEQTLLLDSTQDPTADVHARAATLQTAVVV